MHVLVQKRAETGTLIFNHIPVYTLQHVNESSVVRQGSHLVLTYSGCCTMVLSCRWWVYAGPEGVSFGDVEAQTGGNCIEGHENNPVDDES